MRLVRESGIGRAATYGILILAFLIGLAALLYFVGSSDRSAATTGSVQVAGSESMRPVVTACAELFMARNPKADAIVRGGGSGDGIAALLHGLVDVGMTSRDLSKRERDYALSKGIEITQFPLALDAIAIVVNRTNPVVGLSLAAGSIGLYRQSAELARTPAVRIGRSDCLVDRQAPEQQRYSPSALSARCPRQSPSRICRPTKPSWLRWRRSPQRSGTPDLAR